MINTNTKIDQLNLRVDNIDKQLSNLKSEISSLNESSKLDYFQKLETTISKTKEELDNLKNDPNISQNDLDKVLNIEKKYNTLLENFHGELSSLETSIQVDKNKNKNEDENKPNWRERNKKTVLIGAGTLGVGLLIRHWWKKRKEKKEKNQTSNIDTNKNSLPGTNININNGQEKKARWKKALLRGGGILGGITILNNWTWIKEKLGFGLSFEDSLGAVKEDLNKLSEFKVRGNIGNLSYDESSSEIKSYGSNIGTKIDKKKKRIDGLDLKFSTYQELIFVANFINYLKYNYAGRGASNSPFYSKSRTGDLYIKVGAHIDGKEREEEVISGGLRGTLREYAPSLDPSLTKRIFSFGLANTNGKTALFSYLNNLDIREKGEAPVQDNPDNDPLITEVNDLQEEIQDTRLDLNHQLTRGTVEAIKITDSEYEIRAWGFKEKLILTPEIKIKGMNLSFPTRKEAIRTATLLNKMKYEYGGKGKNANPFSMEYEYFRWGLYVNRKGENMGKKARWRKIRVLDDDTLKELYPTLYKKSNRDIFLSYLNNLKSENNFRGWK
ncbi:MAG: hypothetical protein M0P94_01805 [Candidatus Absconditabacterales bacterium]|nr:hypothetical protein [Candidatus Absconditabacterales bacterium]